jgi:hypothetical protein
MNRPLKVARERLKEWRRHGGRFCSLVAGFGQVALNEDDVFNFNIGANTQRTQ